MTALSIASVINASIDKLNQLIWECIPPSQSYDFAIEYIISTFKGKGVATAIRGPPGTGKTTTARCALEKLFDYIMDNEIVFLHTAPTNELTFEIFTKVFPIIYRLGFEKGYSLKDVLTWIKILGSGIPEPYFDYENYNWLTDDVKKILKNMRKIDKNTKFIFSTDYQIVYTGGKDLVVFVDEASKHPFYSVFNPVSVEWLRSVAEGKDEVIKGLTIVGDEFQAVSLSPEYRGRGKKLLALPLLWKMLEESGKKNYTTLDVTFRLPQPLDYVLTEGFYKRVGVTLRSGVDTNKRLEPLKDVVSKKQVKGTIASDIAKDIEMAVTTDTPFIVYDIDSKYLPGEFSEPRRVKLAIEIVRTLYELYGSSIDVMVVAPYSKTILDVKYGVISRVPDARVYSYVTTPSALGREADVVITIMGKEYPGVRRRTIHYVEPESLDVLLSRARMLEILVGNVTKMQEYSLKLIQRLSAEIHEIEKRGDIALEKKELRRAADTIYDTMKAVMSLRKEERIVYRRFA